jgi:hypothetical protein
MTSLKHFGVVQIVVPDPDFPDEPQPLLYAACPITEDNGDQLVKWLVDNVKTVREEF